MTTTSDLVDDASTASASADRTRDVEGPSGPQDGPIGRVLSWTSIPATIAMFLLMLHVVANAVMRYLGQPIDGTLEQTAFWYMPLLAFFGFVVAQRRKEHIEARIMFDRMPIASQRAMEVVIHVVVISFCVLLAYFGWIEAVDGRKIGRTAGASGVVIWPFVFAVPLGYVLMAVQVVMDLVRFVRTKQDTPAELEDPAGPGLALERDAILDIESASVTELGNGNRLAEIAWVVLPVVALLASFGVMFTGVADEMIGGLAVVAMLVLMVMRVPLGIAMALPGIVGMMAMTDWRATRGLLSRMPFEQTASWSLSVIPMFILMGLFLYASGLTNKIYVVARQWVGRLPGGLAVGTNVAGAGLASMSGSTLGSIFPLSRAGIPEMLNAGYDRRLAVASVMAAGTLAPLIPPSMLLVIYAGVAQQSVGPQLLAGIVPGIILVLFYAGAIVLLGVLKPNMVGGRSTDRATWRERMAGLKTIIAAPVLVLIVIVGIYTGAFTATEAGAAGALGALAVTLVMRRKDKPWRAVWSAGVDTVSTVGSIFFLLIGAAMLSRLLSISGLADGFAEAVTEMGLSRVQFLLVMVVVFIILGMFMDSLAMILLTVPILLPLMEPLGISEIWFGVFAVVFMEIAMVTPPVGVLSYVVHGIVQSKEVNVGQKISLGDVFQAVLMFLPVILLLVGIMIALPEIVTWIPDNSAGQ